MIDGKVHKADYTLTSVGKFDVEKDRDKRYMHDTPESQYATEFATVAYSAGTDISTVAPFKTVGYVDGYTKILDKDGKVLAMQSGKGHETTWLKADAKATIEFALTDTGATLTYTKGDGEDAAFVTAAYNSEADLAGEYLGEVELVMKDYHFNPRPIALGVTWTQLTELVLDTSFGVSAEEMLLDSAAQEIKKTLDFQSIKMANFAQQTNGMDTFVFNAEALDGAETKDSYWHTAQTVTQALDGVTNTIYNQTMRGGISAIVGGPAAISYLKLNEHWKDVGRMPAIGAYKVGEIDGIPCYKVPAQIIPNGELLTTWKNDAAEGDVCMAIGTLLPFFSTGAIQRKNFYKEAGISRYEDSKVLRPDYLGRIKITNIRGYADTKA